jgi:hypothetical protein
MITCRLKRVVEVVENLLTCRNADILIHLSSGLPPDVLYTTCALETPQKLLTYSYQIPSAWFIAYDMLKL